MVKSYGVGGSWVGGPGHFTVNTGTGRSFDSQFSIFDSRFSILDSLFYSQVPGPRSQVTGPRSQVPGPKSKSQSLDNFGCALQDMLLP